MEGRMKPKERKGGERARLDTRAGALLAKGRVMHGKVALTVCSILFLGCEPWAPVSAVGLEEYESSFVSAEEPEKERLPSDGAKTVISAIKSWDGSQPIRPTTKVTSGGDSNTRFPQSCELCPQ